MHPDRQLSNPLILPILLTALAGIGWWLQTRWPSPGLRVLIGGLLLLGTAVTLYSLRQRQLSGPNRLSPGGWWRLGFAAVLLFVVGFGVVGSMLAQDRANDLIHPQRTVAARTPESVGVGEYRDVTFTAADGITLRGWYVPPANGAAIILVHGLGGNRGALLEDAALLVEHGYGVLLFDLRNAGESEGEITTLGLLEINDVLGAVDFVLAQPRVKEERVGLLGHSMGGATVILAAARDERVRAVVAQSAYTSLEDNVGDSLRQLTGLPPFPFAPMVIFFGEREAGFDIADVQPVRDVAAISPRALLIVHGEADALIPVANAYELYEAAAAPKEIYIIPGGNHYGLWQNEPQNYEERIVGFWDEYLLQP